MQEGTFEESAREFRWTRPQAIITLTVAYLVTAIVVSAVSRRTGNGQWIADYLQMPGAVLTVCLAAVQLLLSFQVYQRFMEGEMLRKAWQLIALSAAVDLAASFCVQILANPRLSPLEDWPVAAGFSGQQVGAHLGGPLRFAILAFGLYYPLQVYRRSGFLGKLSAVDWTVLGLLGAYLTVDGVGVLLGMLKGRHPSLNEIIDWPSDLLMLAVLAEAMLLKQSAKRMGSGWVSNCWRAISAAVFLVLFGDVGAWATVNVPIQWPWTSLVWLIWVPAAACFALAPAYQLETIQRAAVGGENGA